MAEAQIPHGYKQTEVGVIPEDWEVKSVHEIATIKTGPFGTLLKASEYSEGDGVPLISVGEIREGFLKITDQTPRVPDGVIRRLPQYVLKKGDIVFGRKGAVDRSALIRQQQEGWFLGSDGISIRPSKDCHGEYLALQFQSARVKGWLLQNAIGTTMPSLNQEILRNVVVSLPPTKAEQEAIAEALSDADALIESLEHLIAKKYQIKQGTMQELLIGKKRLPGFSGEWKEAALGQMGKCYRGVSYNPSVDLSPFDTESTIRLLRSNNVQESKVVFSDMQYVNVNRVSEVQRLRLNDILICMANGSRDLVGKAGRFSADDGFEYTFGAFMGCFRIDSVAADPDFVFYLFQTEKYRAHIAILLAGSSINNLTPSNVESLLISVPSDRAEQTAIATILTDIDAEIAALEEKLAKARQLKQGMMQELLTGRIRLV
jgi:type I restriction enzyme S subunit